MKKTIITFSVVALLLFSFQAFAKNGMDEGDNLFKAGSYKEAAKWYLNYANTQAKGDKEKAEALNKAGQSLEKLSDGYSADAEQRCYWKSRAGAACMENYVRQLNAEWGEGAFEYVANLNIIKFAGSFYKQISSGSTDESVVCEADYNTLSRNLLGQPDEVLGRIDDFMQKYPEGACYRKGLLLKARINEDLWYIHLKWSFVLYNWRLSEEELIVRSEKYRTEAVRLYEELIKKYKRTPEAEIAKKELNLAKQHKTDGKLYGIINESMVQGISADGFKQEGSWK
jgi:hypothetical protein